MSTYVIQRMDGKFWVGPGRWSEEPTGAFRFKNWKAAAEEAMNSLPIWTGYGKVIADFGLDSEREVLQIRGNILPTEQAG